MPYAAFKRRRINNECSRLPAASVWCHCSPTHWQSSHKINCSEFREMRIRAPNEEHAQCAAFRLFVVGGDVAWTMNLHMQERLSALSLVSTVSFVSARPECAFSHILFPSKCQWRKWIICLLAFVAHAFLKRQQLLGKLRAQSVGERLSFVAQ